MIIMSAIFKILKQLDRRRCECSLMLHSISIIVLAKYQHRFENIFQRHCFIEKYKLTWLTSYYCPNSLNLSSQRCKGSIIQNLKEKFQKIWININSAPFEKKSINLISLKSNDKINRIFQFNSCVCQQSHTRAFKSSLVLLNRFIILEGNFKV